MKDSPSVNAYGLDCMNVKKKELRTLTFGDRGKEE